MQKIITWFDGKKTYMVCIVTIIYALIGGTMGFITWSQAIQMVLTALGAAGLRNAIR